MDDDHASPARLNAGLSGDPSGALGPGAQKLADDYDVLMAYQVLLERDPENSFVIQERVGQPIGAVIQDFMRSVEFSGLVAQPLARGARLVHGRSGIPLSAEQIAWIADFLPLPENELGQLRSVTPRRSFVLAGAQVPAAALALGAPIEGKGWAIAKAKIEQVAIYVGETFLCHASLEPPRPDIAARFPHYAQANKSGFSFSARLGRAADLAEPAAVVVAVRTADGATTRKSVPLETRSAADEGSVAAFAASRIYAARVTGIPDPATPSPPQLGHGMLGDPEGVHVHIDSPRLKAGRMAEPLRSPLTLTGWAVLPGGIGAVDVQIDERSPLAAHRGIRREDVAAQFPDRERALFSGFALTIPQHVIGEGEHAITVLIHANSGHVVEREFRLVSEKPDEAAGTVRRFVPEAEIALRTALLRQMDCRPFFLVLIRTQGVAPADIGQMRTTLHTLQRQAYPDWRAVVLLPQGCDEARSAAAIGREDANLLQKVRLQARSVGGQADRWPWPDVPDAQFLLVVGAGDRLGADALLALAETSGLERSADFLYSDERCYDLARQTMQPWCKPDWSPEMLLSMNYVGRVWCAARELAEAAGITPQQLAQHGEYDAVLRLTEKARAVAHLPAVLCERGAVSLDAPEFERRALQRAAERRGWRAKVLPAGAQGRWRLRRPVARSDLVSIVIPTCAARGLIENTIRAIRERTSYRRIEIVCIDNIEANQKNWKRWLRRNADRVIEAAEEFNWSHFNNRAAAAANGKFLLFLNDDIEVREEGWLKSLLEQAQQPEIGVAGPRLLYPDGTVQHAGIFMSGGAFRHAYRFAPGDEPGPFGQAAVARNVLAVTGACMLMRRSVFEALGGFDEAHGVINNDVDFCLRVWQSGLRVVYTPFATLTHHELASRANLADAFDRERFHRAWGRQIAKGDPFFNPALTPDSDGFGPDPEPVEIVYPTAPLLSREQVRRILAVMPDGLADVVSALPALRRLKLHFPEAELSVLAGRPSQAAAALEPAIERRIDFDPIEANEAERCELERKLKPLRFDIAIDLGVRAETRALLRETGAVLLAGFDQRGRFPWLDIALEWEGEMPLAAKRSHLGDRLTALVDAIDIACERGHTGLAQVTKQQALMRLRTLPAARGAPAGFFDHRLVCVHACASDPMQQWPVESFSAVVNLLLADGLHIVLIGGAEDAAAAQSIAAMGGKAALLLVGELAPADFPLVLQACDLFLGGNGGPAHLAAALGVPTVSVLSGNVDARECAPRGPNAIGVRRKVACGPCYLSSPADCHRGLACLAGIRPSDAYQACRPLLRLSSAPAARD